MRRGRAATLVVGAGSLAAVVLLRRRSGGRGERLDIYLADGSKLTHDSASPEFARLAPLARDALRAAQ